MHVQSCYFANLNQLVYCRSRCRRRRPCFPYFIHGTYVSLSTKSYLFISVFTDLLKLSSEVIYIFIYLHVTLGARDVSSAVSGFCQVFRGFGLRPKMCRPSANTENSHRTREKPLVPRVLACIYERKKCT